MKTATWLMCAAMASAAVGCGGVPPQEGTWSFAETKKTDSCHLDQASFGDGGSFTLADNGDGTFVIDPDDSEARFTCTLDGDAFECPSEVAETVTQAGIDAVLSVKVSVEGTFDSDSEASGSRTGNVTCSGSDCAQVGAYLGAQFPCQITTSFDAHAGG